jgi:hypothetical protein
MYTHQYDYEPIQLDSLNAAADPIVRVRTDVYLVLSPRASQLLHYAVEPRYTCAHVSSAEPGGMEGSQIDRA